MDPECVSGLGGGWGWVSRWEADLGSPAWSMPHAGRSVACAARDAISSCSSPGPVLWPSCPGAVPRGPAGAWAPQPLAQPWLHSQVSSWGPLCLRRPAWGPVVPCASSRGQGMWWEPGVGSVLPSWGLGSAGSAPRGAQPGIGLLERGEWSGHTRPSSECLGRVCGSSAPLVMHLFLGRVVLAPWGVGRGGQPQPVVPGRCTTSA